MKYFSESGIKLRYGTDYSAGIDLPFYDQEKESITLQSGQTMLIKTGIHIEIPNGYVGILDTRSSSGKLGIDLMCRTIDSDFRGNIRLMIINHSDKDITISRGDYIAQLVVLKLQDDRILEEVHSLDELSSTERGEGGFGSTGKGLIK